MQWALIRLLASRLLLRKRPAGAIVGRVLVGALLVVLACGVAVVLGASSLLWIGGLGVASLVLLAMICVRLFPTAMAVSILGIALSCASLMTVLGVTTGFEREILAAVARVNGHVLLTKYGLDFFEYESVSDGWVTHPEVAAASPFAFSMVAVVKTPPPPEPGAEADPFGAPPQDDSDNDRGPSVVIGKGVIPARVADMAGFTETLSGGDVEVLRPGDSRHRPGIVLGFRLAHELRVEVGDFVRVVVPAEIDGSAAPSAARPPRHATFEVLDTMHTGTSDIDGNLVLMHISAAQALFFGERRVTGIEFQLVDPADAEDLAATMGEGLGYPYRVSHWRQTNAALLATLTQIRITLSLILGLMILVSASSLVASLLLIVRSKRHDIGVLLAVGGDRRLVFWMFEATGLLAGAIGASFGIGLGALYCVVIGIYEYPLVGDVYPIDNLPVVVGALDVLVPALSAIALCGVASGPCALLAARTRLLTALAR